MIVTYLRFKIEHQDPLPKDFTAKCEGRIYGLISGRGDVRVVAESLPMLDFPVIEDKPNGHGSHVEIDPQMAQAMDSTMGQLS
jgi:hypothetical protein